MYTSMAQNASERTTVDVKREISEQLLEIAGSPAYDGGTDRVTQLSNDSELRAFLDRVFEEVAVMLADNHSVANDGRHMPTGVGDYESAKEVLAEDNVADIDVVQNGWHSPTVRVWLNNAPAWANDSDRIEFKFSEHRPHYNGNVAHAVIDVRQS